MFFSISRQVHLPRQPQCCSKPLVLATEFITDHKTQQSSDEIGDDSPRKTSPECLLPQSDEYQMGSSAKGYPQASRQSYVEQTVDDATNCLERSQLLQAH